MLVKHDVVPGLMDEMQSMAIFADSRERLDGTWSASVPALSEEAEAPRDVPPVYVAAATGSGSRCGRRRSASWRSRS